MSNPVPDDRLDDNGDIISRIDLRDAETARTWAIESASKRPWRPQFRVAFARVLQSMSPLPKRILELGSGPGLLAQTAVNLLEVDEYVLFDFSRPMMDMAREALGVRQGVSYVLGDFKSPGWSDALAGPFDAIISMQAVHEIRHKRHVPGLYAEACKMLRSGGLLMVCDYEPREDDEPHLRYLNSTRADQTEAMLSAGLEGVVCREFRHQYYLISGEKP